MLLGTRRDNRKHKGGLMACPTNLLWWQGDERSMSKQERVVFTSHSEQNSYCFVRLRDREASSKCFCCVNTRIKWQRSLSYHFEHTLVQYTTFWVRELDSRWWQKERSGQFRSGVVAKPVRGAHFGTSLIPALRLNKQLLRDAGRHRYIVSYMRIVYLATCSLITFYYRICGVLCTIPLMRM